MLALQIGSDVGMMGCGFLGHIAEMHGIRTALLLIGIAPILGAACGVLLSRAK